MSDAVSTEFAATFISSSAWM